MISFAMLSALARAMFALWALLLCLANSGSAVIAAFRKRFLSCAFALGLFAPGYFMWQVIFDFSLFGKTEKAVALCRQLCALPLWAWLIAFFALTPLAGLLLAYNIRYDKTSMTPAAIKLYLDKVPCGICCWQENGRVLFSNICMNSLCLAMTKQPLLNGNDFRDAVGNGLHTLEGKVWRFACREIGDNGKKLFEMIASDITGEYAKTAALEKDKAELSRLNSELWEYYLSIDTSVHRKEILQAKMNIHDEMNRLMLSTMAADKDDTAALNQIFSLWEQNALLLCMEADSKVQEQKSDALEALANALNIRLIWRAALPEALEDKQRELFFYAAQEAIINAVKHAQAETMELFIETTAQALICRFRNDGKLPQGEVHFEGGLANLALLAREQNASICVNTGEMFELELRFKNTSNIKQYK